MVTTVFLLSLLFWLAGYTVICSHFFNPVMCRVNVIYSLKVAVARREEIIKRQDEAIRSLEVISDMF